MDLTPTEARALLARFAVRDTGPPSPMGGGHINASFLVPGEGPAGPARYILQQLNPSVFPDGASVVANVAQVAAHLAAAARATGRAGWRVACPIPAETGMAGVRDASGAWWRLFPMLEGTRGLEQAGSPAEALQVGRAFGTFHALMATYRGPPLVEILPGFHDTPARCAQLEAAAGRAAPARLAEAADQLDFARANRAWAGLLTGRPIPGRVAHNDAKAANVLLDASAGQAVAVVDLDTAMHGTLLHDVGDLIRSSAGTAAEDAGWEAAISVDTDRFTALMEGFVAGLAGLELAPAEWELFVAAGMVITFEQGIRFLTDFLDGDRYYRITRAGQNLDRARAQFRLAAALAREAPRLERTVAGLRRPRR